MRTSHLCIAVLVAASAAFVTEAVAQKPPPAPGSSPSADRPLTPSADKPAAGAEKTIGGEVKSIDASEREITLADGTTLVVPPNAALRPAMLKEGMNVSASYREGNGQKMLTGLRLAQPAASPRTEPTPGRTPPSSSAPSDDAKRR